MMKHPVALREGRPRAHLQRVSAVFQHVRGGNGLVGKLPLLPDRDHADAQRVGHGRAEDEPAGLDGHHLGGAGGLAHGGQLLDHPPEGESRRRAAG